MAIPTLAYSEVFLCSAVGKKCVLAIPRPLFYAVQELTIRSKPIQQCLPQTSLSTPDDLRPYSREPTKKYSTQTGHMYVMTTSRGLCFIMLTECRYN